MNIEHFGKGAIQTPEIIARSKFSIVEEPLRAINWAIPFTVENGFLLTQRDQKSSSSCTGQSTAYYTEALNKIENGKNERHSARHSYSQAALPGGGAYIWKTMSIPLNPGAASLESVPEGDSSEDTMTNQSLNASAKIEARTDKYAQIPNKRDINWLAQVIQDYNGFITGFNGSNDMFAPDGTIIRWDKNDWGHAVYVVGFETRNGVRCLKFKNSWSSYWGSNGYGYFPEEFIKTGPIFDAYVYAEVTDLDPSSIAMTEEQLNNLWLAAFKRPIDPEGLAFYKGKSFDTVIKDILDSKEHLYYKPLFEAAKNIEKNL